MLSTKRNVVQSQVISQVLDRVCLCVVFPTKRHCALDLELGLCDLPECTTLNLLVSLTPESFAPASPRRKAVAAFLGQDNGLIIFNWRILHQTRQSALFVPGEFVHKVLVKHKATAWQLDLQYGNEQSAMSVPPLREVSEMRASP